MRLRLQGWGIHVSFQRVATVRATRMRTGAVANDPQLPWSLRPALLPSPDCSDQYLFETRRQIDLEFVAQE